MFAELGPWGLADTISSRSSRPVWKSRNCARPSVEERTDRSPKCRQTESADRGRSLFKEAVEKCIARKEGEFRSEMHRKNWRRSMDAYAVPIIGNMNVAHIAIQDILRAESAV